MRSLVTYLLLVIPPLGGLLAILYFGGRLTPPRSIGGTWTITSPLASSGERCPPPATLRVQQSGPRAELAFGDDLQASLVLELDGDRVRGASRPRSGPCPLALEARLVEPHLLEGTLRTQDCSTCPPLPFRAVREPVKRQAAH
jgi:hypothetical protein